MSAQENYLDRRIDEMLARRPGMRMRMATVSPSQRRRNKKRNAKRNEEAKLGRKLIADARSGSATTYVNSPGLTTPVSNSPTLSSGVTINYGGSSAVVYTNGAQGLANLLVMQAQTMGPNTSSWPATVVASFNQTGKLPATLTASSIAAYPNAAYPGVTTPTSSTSPSGTPTVAAPTVPAPTSSASTSGVNNQYSQVLSDLVKQIGPTVEKLLPMIISAIGGAV